MMKECNRCDEAKSVDEFSRDSSMYDALQGICKTCNRERVKAYSHTKEGLVTRIYAHQKQSSKQRGHAMPTYSKKELKQWLFAQVEFHRLYDNWKRLDFQTDYVPSVDRLDDSLGYTIANIQLLTWKENYTKGHDSHKRGEFHTKPVFMVGEDGIATLFVSGHAAERATGIPNGNINKATNGKLKTAGGKQWQAFHGFKVTLLDEEI